MIWATVFYIAAVAAIAGLLVFWNRWRIPLYAGLLLAIYVSSVMTLSHPRPSYFGSPEKGAADVLGGKANKGERIYLLLMKKGDNRPVYQSFPWDDELARKLQQHRFKGGVQWDRSPWGDDKKLKFIPPLPLPTKPPQPQTPEFGT